MVERGGKDKKNRGGGAMWKREGRGGAPVPAPSSRAFIPHTCTYTDARLDKIENNTTALPSNNLRVAPARAGGEQGGRGGCEGGRAARAPPWRGAATRARRRAPTTGWPRGPRGGGGESAEIQNPKAKSKPRKCQKAKRRLNGGGEGAAERHRGTGASMKFLTVGTSPPRARTWPAPPAELGSSPLGSPPGGLPRASSPARGGTRAR